MWGFENEFLAKPHLDDLLREAAARRAAASAPSAGRARRARLRAMSGARHPLAPILRRVRVLSRRTLPRLVIGVWQGGRSAS